MTKEHTQSDEIGMGMAYAELTAFGMNPVVFSACEIFLIKAERVRKERKMGSLSMWQHLVHVWGKDRVNGSDNQDPSLEPAEIAKKKVKFFFVN